ncbi:MAG: NAD(P)(+) transhydrogenase (Re/Si-specific) subunit beta [Desulfobacterales bacterium]|jgi:NAD(P) transhydrogenase subunit beta
MVNLTAISYLLAATLFILGLKRLGSPKTARSGNLAAMLGMLIAIVITLLDRQILGFGLIITGLIVGAAVGTVAARKVEMTAMPQMVALFNGLGGIASSLVAFAGYLRLDGAALALPIVVTTLLSLLIGTATFSGSLIAFAKLQGLQVVNRLRLPQPKVFNVLLLLAALACAGYVLVYPGSVAAMLAVLLLSALYGLVMVIPVGGADMPVIIALLNSYSGLAASATGFVLSNPVLIISGALVGASGLILTRIMCKAMNRDLRNVLFAGVGATASGAGGGDAQRTVTRYSAEEAAMIMETAQSVIIVPGYGLAVAQAQHVLHEMATLLAERGTTVRYAIHPVAGRMPGHMNVLLAEANVPYDLLLEMDEINDDFKNTDMVLVVGANDVTNSHASCCEPDSPLYGMPTLNVDQAKSTIVIKRSLSPGFAGVDNELFYNASTMMLFGDAKAMVTDLVKEIKAL